MAKGRSAVPRLKLKGLASEPPTRFASPSYWSAKAHSRLRRGILNPIGHGSHLHGPFPPVFAIIHMLGRHRHTSSAPTAYMVAYNCDVHATVFARAWSGSSVSSWDRSSASISVFAPPAHLSRSSYAAMSEHTLGLCSNTRRALGLLRGGSLCGAPLAREQDCDGS